MNASCQLKDQILEAALPDVVFDGWSDTTLTKAIDTLGLDKDIYRATFPKGMIDVIAHFADWADRKMLDQLEVDNIEDMRIRDRIRRGVLTRLDVLAPHKEAVRLAMHYWGAPHRGAKAGKALWHTADRIWQWAGDTATDYNRYTKRALLSALLASTTYAWLKDETETLSDTNKHLDQKIEHIMKMGQFIGKLKCKKADKREAV
ncbi:MAG: COQ9 family protein [Alphaproteobacteria bacterium]|nr:COQ9 family protein [Alphaproteobacteria bacterium]